METISIKETKVRELGLDKLSEALSKDIDTADPKQIQNLLLFAKLGLSAYKEVNLMLRSIENNYIRAFRSMAENKAEMKRYICASMPKYKTIVKNV